MKNTSSGKKTQATAQESKPRQPLPLIDDFIGASIAHGSDCYTIEGKLTHGQGGMGTVYLARNTAGSPVALKITPELEGVNVDPIIRHFLQKKQASPHELGITPPPTDTNAKLAQRFIQEAQTLQRLDHPNIVKTYGWGSVPNCPNRLFLAMHHVDGTPLSVILKDGLMPMSMVKKVLEQTCDGMAAVHDLEIVHRDLKLANLIVKMLDGGDLHVTIIDFGAVKVRNSIEHLTVMGDIIGTSLYLSPEQIDDSSTVDCRSDIYNLGIVMYQLLTGTVPFNAKYLHALLTSISKDKPELPSRRCPERGISRRMNDVVLKALSKDPADRFQSMGGFKAAIEECDWSDRVAVPAAAAPADRTVSRNDIPSPPPGLAAAPFPPTTRDAQTARPRVSYPAYPLRSIPRKSHRLRTALLIGGGALAIGAVGFGIWQFRSARTPLAEQPTVSAPASDSLDVTAVFDSIAPRQPEPPQMPRQKPAQPPVKPSKKAIRPYVQPKKDTPKDTARPKSGFLTPNPRYLHK